MTDASKKPTAAEAAGTTGENGDSLALIYENSRETLELLRQLVQLLLPKSEPKKGPTLEELIAALVAHQRDQMVLLRQIQAGIGAVLDRLPEPGLGGDGPDDGRPGPNGRHRA